jgi:alpha-tubulin suppressor-like RCC1 family protein
MAIFIICLACSLTQQSNLTIVGPDISIPGSTNTHQIESTSTPALTPTPSWTNSPSFTPTEIPKPFVTSIVSSAYTSCALMKTGEIRCWGDEKAMGTYIWDTMKGKDGSPLAERFTAVSLGPFHGCAITTSGGVMCWGNGESGRLGAGVLSILQKNGPPLKVVGLDSGVSAIAAGGGHACALLNTGGVKCWGDNSMGQLGTGSEEKNSAEPVDVPGLSSGVAIIKSSYANTCVAMESGGVKCWGNGKYGQLGNGKTSDSPVPVDVIGITDKVTILTLGLAQACASTGKGMVCWGANSNGQIGNGNITDQLIPVRIPTVTGELRSISGGFVHTCAITSEGKSFCWGRNDRGQLGDGTIFDRHAPTQVKRLPTNVVSIAAGGLHTCALTDEGQAYCWGDNDRKQLNLLLYQYTPNDVLNINNAAVSVVAGEAHNCAILKGGKAKCWGSNDEGQTGIMVNGHYTGVPQFVDKLPAVSALAAAGKHTCGLTTAGGVMCWGEGGLLGDGTYYNANWAVQVVGLTGGVKAIAMGELHTCAITGSGAVKCWGKNNQGQLGTGNPDGDDHYSPEDVVGWDGKAISIAAGDTHTCVLMEGGGVKCWGGNGLGQLGDGKNTMQASPVDVVGLSGTVDSLYASGGMTCVKMDSGAWFCWGFHNDPAGGRAFSSLAPVELDDLQGAHYFATGNNHLCVLTAVGEVQCWGHNQFGQLGAPQAIGTERQVFPPVKVEGLGSEVVSLSVGGDHTCAALQDGSIKCWGSNDRGQIGDGIWDDLHWGYSCTPILQNRLML